MIVLLILLPVFYWLLYETYWLTIRLPMGKSPIPIKTNLKSIMRQIPLLIYTGFLIATILRGYFGIKWYHIFKKLLPPPLPTYLR